MHYRELPVKDDGAGGHRARLAVRLLRWVEGTPMVCVGLGWVGLDDCVCILLKPRTRTLKHKCMCRTIYNLPQK